MRQPTSEEMIAGIAQAWSDKLDQLVHNSDGMSYTFAHALSDSIAANTRDWLDANTDKLIAAIAEKLQCLPSVFDALVDATHDAAVAAADAESMAYETRRGVTSGEAK